MDVLDLLLNHENRAILAALAGGPVYPRRLAERLARPETEVSRALKALERAGLVEGGWARYHGANVRLYRLVARRLEVVLESDGYRLEMAPPHGRPAVRSRPQQLPTRLPLFGREEELARLQDPKIYFSMVVGIAGMGKTSLATELAHRVDVPVFWHAGSAFDTAVGFLEKVARWLWPSSSPLVRMFEGAGLDLADASDRITERLDRAPALLVVDDFHEIRDEGIVEILRRWQGRLTKTRILVLSRTRPPFSLTPTTQLLALSGLRPEASRVLLRSQGVHVSEAELVRLQRRFGGHPLALVLYGRGAKEEKADAALLEELGKALPGSLAPDVRAVLLALASVRRPAGLSALRALTGLGDPSLPLIVLERRGLVRSTADGWEIHAVIREALRPIVDARRDLHRRAMEYFVATGGPEDALEALHHAVRAGEVARAMRLLEADLLEDGPGWIERGFLGLYLEALEGVPAQGLTPREEALLAYGRGRILASLGRRREAVRRLSAALRGATAAKDRKLQALVSREMGNLSQEMGRPDAAERAYRRYVDLVEAEGWDARRADAAWRLHSAFHKRGQMGPARRLFNLAVREARRTGNQKLLLEMSTFCSMAWPRSWARVMPTLRRRAAVFRRLGRPDQVASAHVYLGEIACREARFAGARGKRHAGQAPVYLDRALRGFETLGDPGGAANARSWRALALLQLGREDEARRDAEAVVRAGRTLGIDHSAILGHQVLARLERFRGSLDRARDEAEAAVAVARRFDCRCTGQALLERAFIEEALHGPGAARRMLIEAVRDAIRRGYPDEAQYARREARRRGLPTR